MLLLDDEGRLMGHEEVAMLQRSLEGRKAFKTLYYQNRAFAAAMAVTSYLYSEGKAKEPEDDDFKIVRALIETIILAEEEEQDRFALLFAKQDLLEC